MYFEVIFSEIAMLVRVLDTESYERSMKVLLTRSFRAR